MVARRLGLVLCFLLVLAALGTATATAVPPPTPFCSACGDAFEADVAQEYPELTVEESTATIAVHENGSATWVVRNRLDGGASAEALADDPLLAEVGRFGGLGAAQLTGASAEDEHTLVLRYRDPTFAEPAGSGTIRSGAFTSDYGYRNFDGLGADRLTVEAPDGTRVDWAVPDATVADDGSRMTLTEFERGGFVTFVPRDRTAAPLSSLAAVGQLVLWTLLVNALGMALLPAAVVGSLAAWTGTALTPQAAALAPVRAYAVAGFSTLGGLSLAIGLGALGIATAGSVGPAAVGVGLGLLAFAVLLRRRQRRSAIECRTLAVAVGSALCVAVAGAFAVAVAFQQPDSLRAYPWRTLVVAPLLGGVLAGYALERGRQGLAAATIALGLAVALLPAAPVGDVFLGWLVLVPSGTTWAVLLTGVSAPFTVAGIALAGDGPS